MTNKAKTPAIGLVRHPVKPLKWPLNEEITQEQAIQDYAHENGYSLLPMWINLERKLGPDETTIDNVLDALPNDCNTIIVHDISRLGRSLPKALINLTGLYEKGVNIISATDGISLKQNDTDASSSQQTDLLLYLSDVGKALLKESTVEGRIKSKRKGVKLGRPKLGKKELKKNRGLKLERLRGNIVRELVKETSLRQMCKKWDIPYSTLYHFVKTRQLRERAEVIRKEHEAERKYWGS